MRIAKILILLALPGFVSCQAGFLTAGAPLLLDEYPGAAAAYSVHQINTGYGGSAIQVRRASDNATADIGFDNGELNIGQLINHCSGTNCFVSIWYDQSGNGRNATQTTAASQPKIYDSSTGIIYENGKPALDFNGTSQYLKLPNLGTISLKNFAVTCIATNEGSGATTVFISNPDPERIYLPITISSVFYAGYNTSATAFNLGSENTDQNLFSLFSGNTNTEAFFNGVGGTTVLSSSTTYNAINFSIGAFFDNSPATISNYWDGKGQAVVLYLTDQTTNRTGIETNLNNFFSIY